MSIGISHAEIDVPDNCVKTKDMIDVLKNRISDTLFETLDTLGINQRYSVIDQYADYIGGGVEWKLLDTSTSMGMIVL